jgi:hypothetical protein
MSSACAPNIVQECCLAVLDQNLKSEEKVATVESLRKAMEEVAVTPQPCASRRVTVADGKEEAGVAGNIHIHYTAGLVQGLSLLMTFRDIRQRALGFTGDSRGTKRSCLVCVCISRLNISFFFFQ